MANLTVLSDPETKVQCTLLATVVNGFTAGPLTKYPKANSMKYIKVDKKVGVLDKNKYIRKFNIGVSLQRDGLTEIGVAYPANSRPDAFVLLGLVSTSTGTQNEEVYDRLGVLHAFQTDIERYVFLMDLKSSNPSLFDAVWQQDSEIEVIFTKLACFILPTAGG
jgi:hypothetical protein